MKSQGGLISIEVPYQEMFGEDWKFDHVEYWGELCFYQFDGKPTIKNWMDYKKWQRCSGVEASGRTFEEMVVSITKKFKKTFGNFTGDDFLTSKEKENHKKEHPFHRRKIKGRPQYTRLIRNKKYKQVNEAEINLRWLKWFLKTDYGKKNWAA